jgi:hypothetical protein
MARALIPSSGSKAEGFLYHIDFRLDLYKNGLQQNNFKKVSFSLFSNGYGYSLG